MNNKADLRKQYLSKRLALHPEEVLSKNDLICDRLINLLKKDPPKILHTFLSQSAKNEVDTWKLIELIRTDFIGTKITAPYVIPGTQEMEHYRLNPETILIPNQWKIPEPDPVTSEKIEEILIDLVVVPLLIFDKKGFRVGYGGGFYDRFLKKCKPGTIKIGLSLFEPIVQIEDINGFDIPLNMCITPEYMYRF